MKKLIIIGAIFLATMAIKISGMESEIEKAQASYETISSKLSDIEKKLKDIPKKIDCDQLNFFTKQLKDIDALKSMLMGVKLYNISTQDIEYELNVVENQIMSHILSKTADVINDYTNQLKEVKNSPLVMQRIYACLANQTHLSDARFQDNILASTKTPSTNKLINSLNALTNNLNKRNNPEETKSIEQIIKKLKNLNLYTTTSPKTPRPVLAKPKEEKPKELLESKLSPADIRKLEQLTKVKQTFPPLPLKREESVSFLKMKEKIVNFLSKDSNFQEIENFLEAQKTYLSEDEHDELKYTIITEKFKRAGHYINSINTKINKDFDYLTAKKQYKEEFQRLIEYSKTFTEKNFKDIADLIAALKNMYNIEDPLTRYILSSGNLSNYTQPLKQAAQNIVELLKYQSGFFRAQAKNFTSDKDKKQLEESAQTLDAIAAYAKDEFNQLHLL